MTNQLEGVELDLAVAEALGWKTSENWGGYYWVDKEDNFHSKSLFHPSTNGQQAMDLLRQFKLNLNYAEFEKEWYSEEPLSLKMGFGQTPEIAICRAIVASKEV